MTIIESGMVKGPKNAHFACTYNYISDNFQMLINN